MFTFFFGFIRGSLVFRGEMKTIQAAPFLPIMLLASLKQTLPL
jgi:hypothetical protein